MDSYSEYSGIVYDSDGSWIQRELITGGSICETGGKFVVIEIMNSLGNFSTSRKRFWHARITAVPEAIRTYESNWRFLVVSVSCARKMQLG